MSANSVAKLKEYVSLHDRKQKPTHINNLYRCNDYKYNIDV